MNQKTRITWDGTEIGERERVRERLQGLSSTLELSTYSNLGYPVNEIEPSGKLSKLLFRSVPAGMVISN